MARSYVGHSATRPTSWCVDRPQRPGVQSAVAFSSDSRGWWPRPVTTEPFEFGTPTLRSNSPRAFPSEWRDCERLRFDHETHRLRRPEAIRR